MILEYRVTGTARRGFAQAVGEILGCDVIYQRAPSFAYAVGGYLIDFEGNLHCPPESDGDVLHQLIAELKERGFAAANAPKPPRLPEITELPSSLQANQQADSQEFAVLAIELPSSGFNAEAIANISKIIQSKATLIRVSIGENLLEKARHLPVEVLEGKLHFPWFVPGAAASDINAYTYLLVHICDMAKRQKYVIAKEREVENQKYAFRCFLLRLGFIGSQYSLIRKILLANLSGNGSYKSGSSGSQDNTDNVPYSGNQLPRDFDGLNTAEESHAVSTTDGTITAGSVLFRRTGPFVFVGKSH